MPRASVRALANAMINHRQALCCRDASRSGTAPSASNINGFQATLLAAIAHGASLRTSSPLLLARRRIQRLARSIARRNADFSLVSDCFTARCSPRSCGTTIVVGPQTVHPASTASFFFAFSKRDGLSSSMASRPKHQGSARATRAGLQRAWQSHCSARQREHGENQQQDLEQQHNQLPGAISGTARSPAPVPARIFATATVLRNQPQPPRLRFSK